MHTWTYDDTAPLIPDSLKPTVKEIDGRGNETARWRDAIGRDFQIKDAEGFTQTQDFDGLNRLVRKTDRRGFKRSTHYDTLGRVTEHRWIGGATGTDSQDFSETTVYDDAQRVQTSTDRIGNRHVLTFDEAGRKIKEEVKEPEGIPGAKTTVTGEWSYDGLDNIVTTKDANTNVTHSFYDTAGRKDHEIQAEGSGDDEKQIAYTYDSMDHVHTASDCKGQIQELNYDGGYRLISEKNGLHQETTYKYDEKGNRRRMRDAEQHATIYNFDTRDRLSEVADPLQKRTRYGYDGNNNRTAMINPNTHLSLWNYDKTNRQKTEERYNGTYPEIPPAPADEPAQKTDIAYNAEGDRIGLQDAKRQSFSYDPDALGREGVAHYPGGGPRSLSRIDRNFDSADRLDSITRTLGDGTQQTRTQNWNYLTRLTQETDGAGGVIDYEYDDNGNRTLTRISLPNVPVREISYTYDHLNRLHEVIDEAGTTTYHYNCRNENERIDHPDGSYEIMTYDGASRLDTKTVYDPSDNQLLFYDYDYNRAGWKTSLKEVHGAVGAPQEQTTYGYFDNGWLRLVMYPDGSSVEYTYDNAGNRTTEILKDSANVVTSSKTYAYNDLEQLTSVTDSISGVSTSYGYDENGNQTSKSVFGGSSNIFKYTSKDELFEVQVDGATVGSYEYDDDGRMVRNNNELRYWDGHSLVAETYAATGGLLRSYTHGSDLLHGTILGQDVNFYVDGLGSVGLALGTERADYRYDAWGNFRDPADCTATPNQLACHNNLTYAGHLFQPESGLIYFGARFYDPTTGRFLTNDPVEGDATNPPSLHQYLYAFNSPMVYTDEWGEYSADDFMKDWDQYQYTMTEASKGSAVSTGRGAANLLTLGGFGGLEEAYQKGELDKGGLAGLDAYEKGLRDFFSLGYYSAPNAGEHTKDVVGYADLVRAPGHVKQGEYLAALGDVLIGSGKFAGTLLLVEDFLVRAGIAQRTTAVSVDSIAVTVEEKGIVPLKTTGTPTARSIVVEEVARAAEAARTAPNVVKIDGSVAAERIRANLEASKAASSSRGFMEYAEVDRQIQQEVAVEQSALRTDQGINLLAPKTIQARPASIRFGPPRGGGGSELDRQYAYKVTGGAQKAIYVNDVEFEGVRGPVLVDAKRANELGFYDITRTDKFAKNVMIPEVLKQARRQLNAIPGTPFTGIEWVLPNEKIVEALQQLMTEEGLDIRVLYRK